jgi:hypothetical protein
MNTTPDLPQLSDTAREEFRRSLLASADRILATPDAAAVLAAFLDGEAFLVLTRDKLWVKPVPPEQPETPEDVTPDTSATDPGYGQYL